MNYLIQLVLRGTINICYFRDAKHFPFVCFHKHQRQTDLSSTGKKVQCRICSSRTLVLPTNPVKFAKLCKLDRTENFIRSNDKPVGRSVHVRRKLGNWQTRRVA